MMRMTRGWEGQYNEENSQRDIVIDVSWAVVFFLTARTHFQSPPCIFNPFLAYIQTLSILNILQ